LKEFRDARQACREAEGPDGLRARPPARDRQPKQAPPALEDAVLAYALEWPTHGPARIAPELRRERYGGWSISSPAEVYKILRRNGLQRRCERLAAVEAQGLLGQLLTERMRKELRPARFLEERRIEAARPGEVILVDTFYIGKLRSVGKVWQYTACDAYGSYGLVRLREVVVPAFRRTYFVRVEDMQHALDGYLRYCNHDRPH